MTSAYFREQAANCARLADESQLQNVRDSQNRAADVWLAMAATAEQTEKRRAQVTLAHAEKVRLANNG